MRFFRFVSALMTDAFFVRLHRNIIAIFLSTFLPSFLPHALTPSVNHCVHFVTNYRRLLRKEWQQDWHRTVNPASWRVGEGFGEEWGGGFVPPRGVISSARSSELVKVSWCASSGRWGSDADVASRHTCVCSDVVLLSRIRGASWRRLSLATRNCGRITQLWR